MVRPPSDDRPHRPWRRLRDDSARQRRPASLDRLLPDTRGHPQRRHRCLPGAAPRVRAGRARTQRVVETIRAPASSLRDGASWRQRPVRVARLHGQNGQRHPSNARHRAQSASGTTSRYPSTVVGISSDPRRACEGRCESPRVRSSRACPARHCGVPPRGGRGIPEGDRRDRLRRGRPGRSSVRRRRGTARAAPARPCRSRAAGCPGPRGGGGPGADCGQGPGAHRSMAGGFRYSRDGSRQRPDARPSWHEAWRGSDSAKRAGNGPWTDWRRRRASMSRRRSRRPASRTASARFEASVRGRFGASPRASAASASAPLDRFLESRAVPRVPVERAPGGVRLAQRLGGGTPGARARGIERGLATVFRLASIEFGFNATR